MRHRLQTSTYRAFISTARRNIAPVDPEKEKIQRSVVQSLRNLLPVDNSQQQQQQPRDGSSTSQPGFEGTTSSFEAEIVPTIHKLVIDRRQSTVERWRKRKSLGGRREQTDGEQERGPEENERIGTYNFSNKRARFSYHDRETKNGEIAFEPSHLAELHLPTRETKWLSRDYIAQHKMRSYVQVLTTPTADTPGTTLLLHFDGKRYLIGSLAEGTQRACVQTGTKLLKMADCFVTGRSEWANTGGLIGMILTLADSFASSHEEARKMARARVLKQGVVDGEDVEQKANEMVQGMGSGKFTLVGPKNMNYALATARRFVFRKGMPVEIHEVDESAIAAARGEEEEKWQPYWADEYIKVWAMSITPTGHAPSASSQPEQRPSEIGSAARNGSDPIAAAAATSGVSQQQRDLLTTKAVVGEMFNSSWRLDTLYATKLSKVNLPATIFIRSAETGKIEKYRGPRPNQPDFTAEDDVEVLVRKPWPGALVESLPLVELAKEAVSYIFKNHRQRGKFDPQAAVRLKVKKGRDYQRLTSGQSVVSEDGQTIMPEQVLAPSKEGGGFAVVSLPDSSYVEPLISRAEWNVPEIMDGVGAVVWSLGSGVVEHPKLQQFIEEREDLEHIIASPDVCANSLSMTSAATSTAKLGSIDGKRWNVPIHCHDAPQTRLPANVKVAVSGQVLQLEPKVEFSEKSAAKALDLDAIMEQIPEEVRKEAELAKESVAASRADLDQWASTLPDKDAEVITLGTGSALPSKYRNVSATLVRVPGWGSILFDAGENTLGQLKRVLTAEELDEVLQSLKCIVISHMHADHHLGTVSVIKAWYRAVHDATPANDLAEHVKDRFTDQQRLPILAEPAMCSWLREYAATEDYGFSRIAPLHVSGAKPDDGVKSKIYWFVPVGELSAMSPSEYQAALHKHEVQPSWLGLQDVQCVFVQHCHGARAFSLTLPSGFKASYSGDCRPSRKFAQIGRGSTVCIHEATFDDELQGDAAAKNHSTTSEALNVAQAMGARTCVLTHFSQRYQKLPVLEYDGSGAGDGVGNGDAAVFNGIEDDEDDLDAGVDDAAGGGGSNAMETLPDQPAAGVVEGTSSSAGPTGSLMTAGTQFELPAKTTRTLQQQNGAGGGSGDGQQPAYAVKFKLTTDMKVCVAFDYMRVKVGEIGEMQHYTPALVRLFAEEEMEKAVSVNGQDGEGEGGEKKLKGQEKKARRNN